MLGLIRHIPEGKSVDVGVFTPGHLQIQDDLSLQMDDYIL